MSTSPSPFGILCGLNLDMSGEAVTVSVSSYVHQTIVRQCYLLRVTHHLYIETKTQDRHNSMASSRVAFSRTSRDSQLPIIQISKGLAAFSYLPELLERLTFSIFNLLTSITDVLLFHLSHQPLKEWRVKKKITSASETMWCSWYLYQFSQFLWLQRGWLKHDSIWRG